MPRVNSHTAGRVPREFYSVTHPRSIAGRSHKYGIVRRDSGAEGEFTHSWTRAAAGLIP